MKFWSFIRPAIGKLFRMHGQHAVGRGGRERARERGSRERGARQVGSGGGRCVSPCPGCQHKCWSLTCTHLAATQPTPHWSGCPSRSYQEGGVFAGAHRGAWQARPRCCAGMKRTGLPAPARAAHGRYVYWGRCTNDCSSSGNRGLLGGSGWEIPRGAMLAGTGLAAAVG